MLAISSLISSMSKILPVDTLIIFATPLNAIPAEASNSTIPPAIGISPTTDINTSTTVLVIVLPATDIISETTSVVN